MTRQITEKIQNGALKYIRGEMAHLVQTKDRSLIYWRSQARQIFERHNDVEIVYVESNKTSNPYLPRGVKIPPHGIYVIIKSTGGRFSRSRKDYYKRP